MTNLLQESLNFVEKMPMIQDLRTENEKRPWNTTNENQNPGDLRDGKLYVYDKKTQNAVRVALITRRPLLILGYSGCGKSSLAINLSKILQWGFYQYVVTSRSQAKDLLYTFDAVRKLSDAQAKTGSFKEGAATDPSGEIFYQRYVKPGPLWWILSTDTALRRGLSKDAFKAIPKKEKPAFEAVNPDTSGRSGAILLIDEIDKAGPDFGNDLLVPFGSYEFQVEEIGQTIKFDNFTAPFLMVVTSNEERELPKAFLRRCVILKMDEPDDIRLLEIAKETLGAVHENLISLVINILHKTRPQNEFISIPELLDTVKACISIGLKKEAEIHQVINLTAWKYDDD